MEASKYDKIIHECVSQRAGFRLIAADFLGYGHLSIRKMRLNEEQQRQIAHFAKQGVKVRLK